MTLKEIFIKELNTSWSSMTVSNEHFLNKKIPSHEALIGSWYCSTGIDLFLTTDNLETAKQLERGYRLL